MDAKAGRQDAGSTDIGGTTSIYSLHLINSPTINILSIVNTHVVMCHISSN